MRYTLGSILQRLVLVLGTSLLACTSVRASAANLSPPPPSLTEARTQVAEPSNILGTPRIDTIRADTTRTADRAPFESRLLFTGTARSISQGEVEVSTSQIVLPQVAVGITDAMSVEAGIGIATGGNNIFVVTPKVEIATVGSWQLAIDALTVVEREDTFQGNRWRAASIPRLIGTAGTPQASVTLGIGVPLQRSEFDTDGFSQAQWVRLDAGGSFRVLSWLRGLTENFIFLGDTQTGVAVVNGNAQFVERTGVTLQSLTGIRLHGDQFATDLGAFVDARDALLFEQATIDAVPYLRFSYRF